MQDEPEDAVFDGEQAGMVDWIEPHWDTLAAVAWRGYVRDRAWPGGAGRAPGTAPWRWAT